MHQAHLGSHVLRARAGRPCLLTAHKRNGVAEHGEGILDVVTALALERIVVGPLVGLDAADLRGHGEG